MINPFAESLVALLRKVGVSDPDIEEASSQGPEGLVMLFTDRILIPGRERLTRAQVAERAGVDMERASAFWRALGFADASDDEAIFTEVDVDMLRRVADIISSRVIAPDLALQTARVIGRSSAQVAAALIDTIRGSITANVAEGLPVDLTHLDDLLDDVDRWIVYVWRRHLAAESKRAVMQIGTLEQGTAVVGFADLVGFTGISQELDQLELAEAVSRFEGMAVDLVGRHNGRIIKMIGDEAMFEAPSERAGAEIALDLVDAFESDPTLPDVRVGIASGPAIRNQGDLFGTAPNLASRLVDQAYPGTVLISESIREALSDDAGFSFKAVRPHTLKGFGRVRYWVLRREGDERPRPAWKLPFLEEIKRVTGADDD